MHNQLMDQSVIKPEMISTAKFPNMMPMYPMVNPQMYIGSQMSNQTISQAQGHAPGQTMGQYSNQ